jgi:hypothetical protein
MTSAAYAVGMARLDAVLNAAPKRRAPTEHHLLLKARTLVDADKGDFEAIISSEAVDREKDVVLAPAMVTALKAWTEVGKLIPLLWSHSAAAEDVVAISAPRAPRPWPVRSSYRAGSTRAPSAAMKHGVWSRAACWDSASAIWP